MFFPSQNGATSAEYIRICKDIVEGSLAEDPSAWRRVLELTGKAVNGLGTVEQKDALIDLYQRATVRFSIEDNTPSSARKDILAMLILYAQIQARIGSIDEARATFRRIQKQPLPLGANFFIAYADFEQTNGNTDRAKEVLRLGIGFEEVTKKLKLLDSARVEKQSDLQPSSLHSIVPRLPPRKDGNFRSPPTLLENMPLKTPEQVHGGRRLMTESDKRRRLRKTNDAAGEGLNKIKSPFLSDDSSTQSNYRHESPAFGQSRVKISSKPSQAMVSSASKRSAGELPHHPKRNKLSSRLARVGLSGKAKRVDPETSFIANDESDSEHESQAISTMTDVTEKAQNVKIQVPTQDSSGVQKVTKSDLSYMWEWDPTSRNGARDKPARLSSHKNMEKIDEASTNGSGTTTSQGTARSNSTIATSSSIRSNDQKDCANNESVVSGKSKRLSSESNDRLQQNKSISSVNPKFLPLVTEDNILTVNGTPYAKLGVIGKGGSCKVYRALSETCSVVAIKKVKLEGMDTKAIEGYANEIALLKRLRGNSSIIEMYDSEVDLEGKSIFVVMELGEVDLNHVLKQRAMASNETNTRSLDMNFVRLTWQQMLSAVHCIHEERIIHSDLKPANFLFVRGSLKLIDFGIAKAIQSDETTNIYRDNTIGTVNYMAPEAILDSGTGNNGPNFKLGRVSV